MLDSFTAALQQQSTDIIVLLSAEQADDSHVATQVTHQNQDKH